MKLSKALVVLFMSLGMALSVGCSNAQPATPKAECSADGDCNAQDKCRVCTSGKCSKVADCCTTDLECGKGMRCWNVKGKAYGKCGN